MTALAFTPSIAIAGFGDPATGKPYRIRYASTDTVSSSVSPALILTAWPESVGDRIDFGELQRSVSTFAFECDAKRSSIGAALLSFLFQAQPQPWGGLLEDISDTDTAIKVVKILGETAPSPGTSIYFEREVMVLDSISWNASGWYDCTVDRGQFGTEAEPHMAGDVDDRYVYSRNPIADSREVWVYDLDVDAGTEQLVWSGMLEQPVRSVGNLRLNAIDALGGVRGTQLGRGRLSFPGAVLREDEHEQLWIDTAGQAIIPPGMVMPDNRRIVVSDGDVVLTTAVRPPTSERGDRVSLAFGSSGYVRTAEAFLTERKTGELTLSECLIAGDDGHPYEDWCMVRDENDELSCHPVDIVLNILTSTGKATWDYSGSHTVGPNGDFDWLPRHWGLGIPSAQVDSDSFLELRDSFLFSELRCPGFIVHEELVDAAEIIKRLLQPLMAFLTIDSEGRFALRSLLDIGQASALSIGDTDLAEPPIEQPWSAHELYSRAIINVGRRGLDTNPLFISMETGLGDIEQNRYPKGRSPLTVECPDYADPESATVPVANIIALRRVNRLRQSMVVGRLPPYVLRLKPMATRLVSGDIIEATLTSQVGPDGTWGIVAHKCLVVSAEMDTRNRTQLVTVVDLSPVYRADKRVAPSWRIYSVTSNTQFVVEASRFSAADRSEWVDGNTYELWSVAGVLRSTDGAATGSINAVTGLVTLTAAWTASGSPVTPAAGDVVRIARYDGGPAIGDWLDQAYVADSDAELGTSGDDPHRWGW